MYALEQVRVWSGGKVVDRKSCFYYELSYSKIYINIKIFDMGGIPKLEFWDDGVLDNLAPSAFKREKALGEGWFHQSEIDGTIPEYESRKPDIDTIRKELKRSVDRLNQN